MSHESASTTAAELRPRLQFIGPPMLYLAEGARALSAIEAALLALPLLRPALGRAAVAELIWPQSADAQNSLRQLSYKLRRLCAAAATDGDLPVLRLPHDLEDAERHWRAEPEALPGELLEGLAWKRQPALQALFDQERARWRERRQEVLLRLAESHRQQGRWDEAQRCLVRLCAEDAVADSAHQALIRLHMQRGHKDDALRVLQRLRQRLRKARLPVGAGLLRLEKALRPPPGAALSPALPLLHPPRMVGRATLRDTLAQAHSARRAVLLHGVAGVGKTRLLAECQPAAPAGVNVRLRPADRGRTLGVFVRALDAQFDQGFDDHGLHPAHRAQLARLLPRLGAPGMESAGALLQALLACWSQAGVNTLLIDDLQYADEASLHLLADVAAADERPWLLMAMRTGEPPPALARWLNSADAALLQLPVPALTEAEVAELLNLLGLQPQHLAALHRHSGGNPLFLLETLRALWDGQAVRLPAAGSLPLPVHVGGLLQERLRQLGPDALQLARAAALADDDLDAPLAAELLKVSALSLADSWAALEAAEVLRGAAFTHELLREAVLREVPAEVARGTHMRIAELLLARNDPARAHRAAAHWLAAECWGAAGAAYRQAALHSRTQRRRDDECRCWQACTEALARAGDAFALAEAQAQSIEALLLAQGAAPALEMAETVLNGPSTPATRATAALGRIKAYALSSRFADVDRCSTDLDLIARHGTPREHLIARIILFQSRAHLGPPAEQLQALHRLREEGSLPDDDEFEYEYTAALAYVMRLADHIESALPLQTRLLALAVRMGDLQEQLTTLSSRSIHYYELGLMEQAREDALQACALRRRMGDLQSIPAGVGELYLGVATIALGRLGEGQQALERARACFTATQAQAWQRPAELNQALAFSTCGQFARARQLIAGDWSSATVVHRMGRELLLARLARWERRPAAELLQQARQICDTSSRPVLQGMWAMEAACHQPAAEAVETLAQARQVLIRHGRLAHAHLAWGLQLEPLSALNLPLAAAEARAFWQARPARTVNDSPAVWRSCARVLRQAGEQQLWLEVLHTFKAWLGLALAPPLEPAFATTLVERNPDVRALLDECRQAGIP